MRLHRSFFPIVLVVLTLALIVFMVFSFSWKRHVAREQEVAWPAVIAPLSEGDYRKEVVATLQPFFAGYDAAGHDLDRLVLTEQALQTLLAMRVPMEARDVHLEVATALHLIREGLSGKPAERARGEDRLAQTVTAHPWLRP